MPSLSIQNVLLNLPMNKNSLTASTSGQKQQTDLNIGENSLEKTEYFNPGQRVV